MPINSSGQFTGDIEQFIQDETLPVAQRKLVIHQLADPVDLPEGRGLTYTATRYNRVPLPYAPLSEGVPSVGQTLTITQVTGTALEWGDSIKITNVAELTTKHPLMNVANQLLGLQIGETYERNDCNALMALTQVNYVNSRGSRAALVAGDVLDPHTVNRTVAALKTIGAYEYMGPTDTDVKIDAQAQAEKAYKNPAGMPHYVIVSPELVIGDFSENQTFVLASSYSNVNALYNYEAGWWRGARFCGSNMLPFWTGFAQNSGTAVPTGGSFAAGTYNIIVTGSDVQNQYESYVAQVGANLTILANGSISVTLPSTTGYTYNVYVGTSTSPVNLGLSSSGPTSGPQQGQATQLTAGATVILTGLGMSQVPPAAPATGVTVYTSYVFGKGAFATVKLRDVKISWLDKADKSDPQNQLRIVAWTAMLGTMISNSLFAARIESTSAFSASFT